MSEKNLISDAATMQPKEIVDGLVADVLKLVGDTETATAVTALMTAVLEINRKQARINAAENGEGKPFPDCFIGFKTEIRSRGSVVTVSAEPDMRSPDVLRTILAENKDEGNAEMVEMIEAMLNGECQCEDCQKKGTFEA